LETGKTLTGGEGFNPNGKEGRLEDLGNYFTGLGKREVPKGKEGNLFGRLGKLRFNKRKGWLYPFWGQFPHLRALEKGIHLYWGEKFPLNWVL